jgi:hypothetical protein
MREIKDEISFLLKCKKENIIYFMEFLELYPELKPEPFLKYFNFNKKNMPLQLIYSLFEFTENGKINDYETLFNLDISEWDSTDFMEYFCSLKHGWMNITDKLGTQYQVKIIRQLKDIQKIKIKFEGD